MQNLPQKQVGFEYTCQQLPTLIHMPDIVPRSSYILLTAMTFTYQFASIFISMSVLR